MAERQWAGLVCGREGLASVLPVLLCDLGQVTLPPRASVPWLPEAVPASPQVINYSVLCKRDMLVADSLAGGLLGRFDINR